MTVRNRQRRNTKSVMAQQTYSQYSNRLIPMTSQKGTSVSHACKSFRTTFFMPMLTTSHREINKKFPKKYRKLQTVKIGFSHPTKVQIGRGQHRIDITNDCEEKALKEGCHERKQSQTDVSSIEKTNTK